MNKIIGWFTKKRLFVVIFVIFLINTVAEFSVELALCSNYASKCFNKSDLIISYTYIFIPVFIFSLITFKLKESTFSAWKRFTFFAVLFTWFIISLLPTYTHGLDFIPLTKGSASYVLTILYSIISLILIIYKSIQKGE